MKAEEFGPIEQDITKEEKQTSEVKTSPNRFPKLLTNIKSLALSIKKPKAITLVILALAIFVVYLALNLLEQKQQEDRTVPKVEQTQPSPQASQDPLLVNISQRIDNYSKKIDSLDTYKKKLIKPIVDLAISFEE